MFFRQNKVSSLWNKMECYSILCNYWSIYPLVIQNLFSNSTAEKYHLQSCV